MKKSLSFLVMLMSINLVASAAQMRTVYEDVDGDGYVTTTDITSLYNYMLNNDMSFFSTSDVDNDGSITVGDVTVVYNYLLGIAIPDQHEYVDLGLPSGTLWATMNIGANAPEEYGNYYAWGETEPKERYAWDNYKWNNGNRFNKLTKYCNNSSYGFEGFTDGLTELEPEDDAATVNWGQEWRMPTDAQLNELLTQCNWLWTTSNGVNGYLLTSKTNGATMFLPAAGYFFSNQIYSTGTIAYYWSRLVNPSKCYNAYYIWFHQTGNKGVEYGDRDSGYTVRAVRAPQK